MSAPDTPVPPQPGPPASPPRSRLRRFFLRHLPLSIAFLALLASAAATGLYLWASSRGFEDSVRRRLISLLERSTGGQVEIASFHWELLHLQADAGGIVLHGLEAPDEAPFARIEHLQARLSLIGILSPSLRLRDLQITAPELHLIVYPDGSTNQPQPKRRGNSARSPLDTIFDLKAGHVAVARGVLALEEREAAFDFQNRFTLLDFSANDLSLLVAYNPASGPRPESYRVQASASDLSLSRSRIPPEHGTATLSLDLMRNQIELRSLTIHSFSGGVPHTLEISGALRDFNRPRWDAHAVGEIDLRLLDPATGFPSATEGIARLSLLALGGDGQFRIDGDLHLDDASYNSPEVRARGFDADAHIHADPEQLIVSSIAARLRQGGELDGQVSLSHWLAPIPGSPAIGPQQKPARRTPPAKDKPRQLHPPPVFIPVDGQVKAQFKDVALDTILDIVGQPPLRRVGLDSRVSGPATATWSNGDARSLQIGAALALAPRGKPEAGEFPAAGAVDATYTQRDGSVDLRRFELQTPGSRIEAHGKMGVYPVTAPTALAVDFHSHNLAEFDTVLRELGLSRRAKTGTAALPAALAGQADFHGSWAGSLVDPRIAGNLKATSLSIEMIPKSAQKPDEPEMVAFDSVEAAGSYGPERIAIDHGLLRRGDTEIALDGSLAAAPEDADQGNPSRPRYGPDSTLHLHLRASRATFDELRPFIGAGLPIAGALAAQIQADGPIHTLAGSGWVELDSASVYGQPVARIRALGSITGQMVRLTSVNVSEAAGKISASGSYDMNSRRFQLEAAGSGLNVAQIEWLKTQGLDVAGKLAFSAHGSGTPEDPRIESNATMADLKWAGEPLGEVRIAAQAANRGLTYDATANLDAAEFKLQGTTQLNSERQTSARLEFSRFNLASLARLGRVKGLGGESALAGVVTLQGPLAQPEKLQGEARLDRLAVTVAGVPLESKAAAHLTLADGSIRLDPLHITGEQTDMQASGSLALRQGRQLDLAASGSINLKLAQTLDPDLTATGTTTFQVEAHGPLNDPALRGRIDIQNGSLSMEDLTNGLSQLHGTLEFNRNRLEVRSLTAMSGGGLLSVSGYLAYQRGVFADLSVSGKGIRIRYPTGVSSLADATLHLQGTQTNLLLSGDVLITRFSVSPELDIEALAVQANAVQAIAPPDAPSNHIRLDVHLASSPQLNFQNAFAKLAGDVDLRLRGTMASPSLLGRVSITEGSALIAGTRYELQHGGIVFNNPVRIEPNIDLNATARVEDYDITLGLHGTPEKLGVTYRSDPPLPEADVVALLALGRTESQQRIYTQQQEQALSNPTTDAFLGGALNATVSSRVQRLFGAGSVKVDPNYLGALGNSTSRIIVEEQLGRNLTLTYATNVSTTSQQLIQAEVAINRHVSLLVARDESGVFSMVVKATRRYR